MVESDIRYYRRRAYEEMAAPTRAVTDAARNRRLQLVDTYLEHLKALDAPNPFDESFIAPAAGASRPAFAWREERGRRA